MFFFKYVSNNEIEVDDQPLLSIVSTPDVLIYNDQEKSMVSVKRQLMGFSVPCFPVENFR